MRDRRVRRILAAAIALVAFAVAAWSPAWARKAPKPPPPQPPAKPGAVAVSPDTLGGDPLRLKLAVAAERTGNRRGVVEQLEPIDYTRPAFDGAERAAFLLGHAYLELGSRDRFERLARRVAAWNHGGPWTSWLAHRLHVIEAQSDASAALERLAAENTTPAVSGLARVHGADSTADAAELEALSSADTTTALGRDLAGAACVRLATQALARGEDARPLLARVPTGSRYAARARHLSGLIDLERGDVERGRLGLAALLAEQPDYADQREVMTALAGRAMDAGDWAQARDLYERADHDWHGEADTLARMLDEMSTNDLWPVWESSAAPSAALSVDGGSAHDGTDRLLAGAGDWRSDPMPAQSTLEAPAQGTTFPWMVAPPPPEDWTALAQSAWRAGEARDALDRADQQVAAVRRLAAERARYLSSGIAQVHTQQVSLEANAARLDTLRLALEDVDRRLRGVRDDATRHVLQRTGALLGRVADERAWMSGMRHWNLDGPTPLRPLATPENYPSPDSMLRAEEAMARRLAAAAESLAAGAPRLIARSYAQAWRPGIIDRAARQADQAAQTLAWARRLRSTIDSSFAHVMPESLEALEARAARLSRTADTLAAAHAELRSSIARHAAERTLAAIGAEREGLDYGLAASAYAMSVALDRSDSSLAAADTSATAAESPESMRWRATALEAIHAFVAAHPTSATRGEMRFREADLRMVEARESFRRDMAAFMRAQSRPGGADLAVPTLDAGPALAIYRLILAEDPDFAHLDAVMFNAGMILADQADPQATPMFRRLVASYPDSRYCQEAYVRMGDVAFTDHRYADCIPDYEHAAQGSDTTMRAISLYKLGWSRFSLDRWLGAADAFRQILDLYAAGGRVDTRVNLADEAEAYLVHTLARAGGAPVFAAYFDSVGSRPYEARLLRAMGQHFRRYSLYAEAAAADRLLIDRHPLEPDALLGAERMIETYDRAGDSQQELAAREDLAPRFAPDSPWYQAQSSDSLKQAGARFARTSWVMVAARHHKLARESGSADEYKQALELYETVLSKWPDDAEAPSLELRAGEASSQVGEYARALRHYGVAAKTGPDSIAALALLQRVAVTDAWYQEAPGVRGGTQSPVSDSLARAVIAAAEDMLKRFPDHPRSGDLMWRQANLAFGHGWYEQSSTAFSRLVETHPSDARAPLAASLAADALFRLDRFGDAGRAYEQALTVARQAGVDSLARRAEQAIPVSYYREAEASVAQDSTAYGRHAELFEKVANGWPRYPHADLARYRAGLAYARAGQTREAMRSMQKLVADYPNSEFVRDARLETARIAEAGGLTEDAAAAYADFAVRLPGDAQTGAVMLKAAELYAKAGQVTRADTLRLEYIRRYPGDVETAMALLEEMAQREIATVDADHPISKLLGAAAAVAPTAVPKKMAKSRAAKAAPVANSVVPSSRLADYMARAEQYPKLASRELIAHVRFLQGEEAFAAYDKKTLSQPLDRSIPAKQKLLDGALARYRQCLDQGDSEWGHGSTYRIGQALVGFGDALMQSERPADLKGDDIVAYNEVLANQAQQFFVKGEDVWTELLKQKQREVPDEAWIRQAQASLWKRLGGRFRFRPEAEVPLIEADALKPPARPDDSTRGQGDVRAQQEDNK